MRKKNKFNRKNSVLINLRMWKLKKNQKNNLAKFKSKFKNKLFLIPKMKKLQNL